MCSGASLAAAADPAAPAEPLRSRTGFSLLPKSLQKNPTLPIAVITEMTDDGRKARVPSAARPMYYLAQSAGYREEGQSSAEARVLSVKALEDLLRAALANNHYLPADAAHPAQLVLIFSWGAANKLDNRAHLDDPADVIGRGDYSMRKNFLARARLVGGDTFARDVERALNQEDEMLLSGSKVIGPRPLEVLENRDPRMQQLLEQAMDDCYFVVASAYDPVAMAHGQRRLLWRTHLTMNSGGVAMAESLPLLIHDGAPYFGREMREAATLPGQLGREGRVEIGPTTVMPDAAAK